MDVISRHHRGCGGDRGGDSGNRPRCVIRSSSARRDCRISDGGHSRHAYDLDAARDSRDGVFQERDPRIRSIGHRFRSAPHAGDSDPRVRVSLSVALECCVVRLASIRCATTLFDVPRTERNYGRTCDSQQTSRARESLVCNCPGDDVGCARSLHRRPFCGSRRLLARYRSADGSLRCRSAPCSRLRACSRHREGWTSGRAP